MFGVNGPFVFTGASGPGLPFTFEVRQVPDALLLVGHVVIDQRYFFGRIYQKGRGAIRANVESEIAMRLAEDVRAEKRSAFGIVEVTEHRGVNVLHILTGIHCLGKAARRFSVAAHTAAKIEERVFHSRVWGALLARGFDRLPGLVS